MFKKNDPLVDSVKAVMEVSDFDRQIEAAVNEEFGVTSKNALPHEMRRKYEQRLTEMKKCAMDEKVHPTKYTEKQRRMADASQRFGSGKGSPHVIDKHDLKAVRKAGHIEELEEKWHEESSKKEEMDEGTLSYKAARAGKDIGKKGKMFAKISKEAGERYGSEKRGEKVAGAVLAKMRKKEGLEERVLKPYAVGMKAAMQSTGDNPPLEKSTIKKAHRIAKKVAKKEGIKLKEQAVFEEIRNNLEEQLVSVYESGDEAAFEAFVNSLNEDQIAILGLNEQSASNPLGLSTFNVFKPSTWFNSPEKPQQSSQPPAKTPMKQVEPETKTSAPDTSSVDKASEPETPSEPVTSASDKTDTEPKTDTSTASEPKTAPKPVIPAPKVSATPKPATGRDGMTMAQRRAKYTPSVDSGIGPHGMFKSPWQMQESTKPQIKESFENFLRNKFLKG